MTKQMLNKDEMFFSERRANRAHFELKLKNTHLDHMGKLRIKNQNLKSFLFLNKISITQNNENEWN